MKNQLMGKVYPKYRARSFLLLILSLLSLNSYGQNNSTDSTKSSSNLLHNRRNLQSTNQAVHQPQLMLLSSKSSKNEKEEIAHTEEALLEIISLQTMFISDYTLVTIKSPTSDEFAKIRILSFTGQTLIEEMVQLRSGQETYPIQLNNLPIGLYSIQVIANGIVISNNLLKQ